MPNTCSLCNDSITDPVEQHANYVRSPRFAEPETVEVFYALEETPRATEHIDRLAEAFPERDRQALAAEAAHPDADEARDDVDFSLDQSAFDIVEVDTPGRVREDNDLVVAFSQLEEREVEKTAVVCPDCTDLDQDDVIWGPDK